MGIMFLLSWCAKHEVKYLSRVKREVKYIANRHCVLKVGPLVTKKHKKKSEYSIPYQSTNSRPSGILRWWLA